MVSGYQGVKIKSKLKKRLSLFSWLRPPAASDADGYHGVGELIRMYPPH